MKEKLKLLFLSEWSPSEKGLLLVDVLLSGILIGWLTSPLKGGITLFSHNGCGNSSDEYITNDYDCDEEDEEED
ncbi:MAG: hypothetical protein LIO94_02600 [Clostridiales bacterium]|nr:hypothetical protein [Clostridiales bacterium]